jgi:protein involved in polysaccharide export with SLBB domain
MHPKAFISFAALCLVAVSPSLAQNSGPPPPLDDYAPSATAGHVIPQRPLAGPFSGNMTGNGTTPAGGSASNVAIVAPGVNSLVPAASGAATAAGSGNNSAAGAGSLAPDGLVPPPRISAVMPISMDLIDNVRPLKAGDQIQYQVVQDRDPSGPHILLVDEQGNVDLPVVLITVPVANLTLREAANKIKAELEKEYYKPGHATVLAAPYNQARARAQVNVFGQVAKPGPVQIPINEVLSVSKAIMAAGNFVNQADPSRVTLVRPDPNDSSKQTSYPVDVATMFTKGDFSKDMIVQAGDIILVPASNDAAGYVWVTGSVGAQGPIPLPQNGTMMASEAIIRAGGFTEWADKSDVTLVRHDAQGKMTKTSVNVAAVLNRGQTEKDVKLQPGDRLIVDEVIFKF